MNVLVPLEAFLVACCLKSDPGLGLFVDWAGGGSVVACSIVIWTYLGVQDVIWARVVDLWW